MKQRIYDCFLFHDELDLLEIRLNEMSPEIDKFVLVESTRTFSGLEKPLYFQQNRQRFAAFESKLHHIVVDINNASLRAWQRREAQCNALEGGLSDLEPTDIALLSDVDEIVSRTALAHLRKTPPRAGEVMCFELRMFNFFLNLEIDETWVRSGPRAVLKKDIRSMEGLRKVHGPSPSPFRNAMRGIKASLQMGRWTTRTLVPNGGWHFSYVGGEKRIDTKLRSYAAYDKVEPGLLDPAQLAVRIRERQSISRMGSGKMVIRPIDDSFPVYLKENRDRFAHLIDPETAK